MNKKIISSVAVLTLCVPAFADIGKTASTATCDSSTIGATSGNAYMDTAWTANTINLDWYNGDTKQTSTTCTYDGSITLPSDPSARTGYTFGGWRVRSAAVTNILATLNISLDPVSFVSRCVDIYACKGRDENGEYFGYGYVDTIPGQDNSGCDDERFENLLSGEWQTKFSYGTIYGTATCATTGNAPAMYLTSNIGKLLSSQMTPQEFMSGFSAVATSDQVTLVSNVLTDYQSGTISNMTELFNRVANIYRTTSSNISGNVGTNCWCHITGYIPDGGTKQPILSDLWAFAIDYSALGNGNGGTLCAENCHANCAELTTSMRVYLFNQ